MAYQGRDQQNNLASAVRAIESDISLYLGGVESQALLTPTEYCDWKLKVKAGQIVLSEVRSDTFDPALEIVDSQGKVVAANDDRYPGDQRPLLFWRSDKDGTYTLRVRCFSDRAGGQFYMRQVVSDCIDITTDLAVERKFDRQCQFFLCVPMKAGQIKQVYSENPDPKQYTSPSGIVTLSPIGLPTLHLERAVNPPIPNTIVAPVDGNYYVLEAMNEPGPKIIRVGAKEIVPQRPAKADGSYKATGVSGAPVLMSVSVKAGEILEATAPDLQLGASIAIGEEPDFSLYDLSKPEKNPFYPRAKDSNADKGPLYAILPGRARDSRVVVFTALRDATLWVSAVGIGSKDRSFALLVKPANRDFREGSNKGNRLQIGKYDYWSFDAKVGDVMSFGFKANDFAQYIVVRDPGHSEIWRAQAAPDQTSLDWSLIAKKPGRYLVAVSAMGDGGGGSYELIRRTFHAMEFSKGSPAAGSISSGETQVWKLTIKAHEPLMLHWSSPLWRFSASVRDEKGSEVGLPLIRVDPENQYAILASDQPATYILVLTGTGQRSSYRIELEDIHGYKKPASAKP